MKKEFRQKFWGFVPLRGHGKNGNFGFVFVFCFEPHTHSLKLESR